MRSFRARALDSSKPLPIHLSDTIPQSLAPIPTTINASSSNTESSQQIHDDYYSHRKQFLHNEPKSDERFIIPIITPVITKKVPPYEIGTYEPPESHYIRFSFLSYEPFMNTTHYDLDDDDFFWLDNERELMRNEILRFEWRAANIDINSPSQEVLKEINGGANATAAADMKKGGNDVMGVQLERLFSTPPHALNNPAAGEASGASQLRSNQGSAAPPAKGAGANSNDVGTGQSALTTVRQAPSSTATKSPRSPSPKKIISSQHRAAASSSRSFRQKKKCILRDEDEMEEEVVSLPSTTTANATEPVQQRAIDQMTLQNGASTADDKRVRSGRSVAAMPRDLMQTPKHGNSSGTSSSAATTTSKKNPAPSQTLSSSTQPPNFNRSDYILINEDIMEDIMDRYEKVCAKSCKFFPKMCDIEPYIPKQYVGIKNLKDMINRVYGYWKSKRKMRRDHVYPVVGKPLLRQFQLAPDIMDDDPRHAFRPRNKELATKKPFPNDQEALNRLKTLREQLERLHKLVWNIKNRELIHKEYINNSYELMKSELQILSKQQETAAAGSDLQRSSPSMMASRKRKRADQQHEGHKKLPHTFSFDKVYRSFLESHQKLCPQFMKLNQVGDLPPSAIRGSTRMHHDTNPAGGEGHTGDKVDSSSNIAVSHYLDQWGTSFVECRQKLSKEQIERQQVRKRRRIERNVNEWGSFGLGVGGYSALPRCNSEVDEESEDEYDDGHHFAAANELGLERHDFPPSRGSHV